MMTRRMGQMAAGLVAGLVVMAASGWAQAGSLLVLSKKDHTLAVVDPVTLRVKGKAPVGDDPHEVIASTDGKTAWISNYGGGTLHTLAVIDLATITARPSIDLGALAGPHGLEFHDGKLYVTVEGSKAIATLEPSTGKVTWVMGTGQDRTHMVWVSPDGKEILTANVASGSLSMLDAGASGRPNDWEQTVIPVGKGAEGFDVSPDGREVWIASAGDGMVHVVNRAAKRVSATLPVGVKGANRLKFTPDGRYVVISTLDGPEVTVLDARTHAVAKRIAVGTGAAGIAVSPDGSRVFVACTPDNRVTVLDTKSWAVTGHVDVGGNPDGMAWVPGR